MGNTFLAGPRVGIYIIPPKKNDGRICGYIERMHVDHLVIDTGRGSGPSSGNMPVDVITRYTFLEVPQWAEDSLQQLAI